MFFVRYGYQPVLIDTLIALVALLTAFMAHEIAPLSVVKLSRLSKPLPLVMHTGTMQARVVIRSLRF